MNLGPHFVSVTCNSMNPGPHFVSVPWNFMNPGPHFVSVPSDMIGNPVPHSDFSDPVFGSVFF
jgi:hypothetical protein